jgi:hypothetical protein
MWAGLNEPTVNIVAPTAGNSWKLSVDEQWYELTLQIKMKKWIGTDPTQNGDVQLSWEPSTGTLPAGTVVMNGSNDITATMRPLAANAKQEGVWRIQSITVRVPAQTVQAYFAEDEHKDATVYPMPTLKAEAKDMAASNFYIASYANGGGQPYIIEADRKVDVTDTYQTAIPKSSYEEFLEMGLRVLKLETGTLIPLAGAVFEIYNPRGQLIQTLATDANGEILLPLGEAGLYSVSNRVVWWRGKCSHSWQASVHNRNAHGEKERSPRRVRRAEKIGAGIRRSPA